MHQLRPNGPRVSRICWCTAASPARASRCGKSGSIANPIEVLSPEEMAKADQLTIAGGTPGNTLMEAAGLAVAEAVHDLLPQGGRVAVMTGPGNNGGDGFVAARLLAEAGYDVSVGLLVARDRLKGDAAFAAAAWTGSSKGLGSNIVDGVDIVVDALFGAGLDRPVEGMAAQAIAAVNRSGLPVVAVDLPSGIDGRSGQVLGTAVRATQSVTFFRLKPGHLLAPGRDHVGKRLIADIGIHADVLRAVEPKTFWNRPGLWTLPALAGDAHKYDRGHAVVVSGPATRTGAARLAARGALRAGAGLVSVASPPEALAVNAAHLTAIMLLPMNGAAGLGGILGDARRNAVALGPALGVGEQSMALVEAALASPAAVVIDADGLTSFAESPDRLFKAVRGRRRPVVLTPHEGEFARLFPDLAKLPSKLERARRAADLSGAVIVLKGRGHGRCGAERKGLDRRQRAAGARHRREWRCSDWHDRRDAGPGNAGFRGGIGGGLAARRRGADDRTRPGRGGSARGPAGGLRTACRRMSRLRRRGVADFPLNPAKPDDIEAAPGGSLGPRLLLAVRISDRNSPLSGTSAGRAWRNW